MSSQRVIHNGADRDTPKRRQRLIRVDSEIDDTISTFAQISGMSWTAAASVFLRIGLHATGLIHQLGLPVDRNGHLITPNYPPRESR